MLTQNMFVMTQVFGQLISIFVLLQCHPILTKHQGEIAKRMDIATCLGKFDVKSDMIIKTEESRKLGAKFLDSADTLSKDECLHLCCETENCDVFVFEEKDQSACFLFHCDPAQDFRCKFTRHANYTSAVFSIEKKVPQQSQVFTKKANTSVIPLSQNEIDLKSLKGKSFESGNVKSQKNDVIVATIATTIKSIIAPIKNASSHCSRFQFQCHSGDCIAVYNACDGIPQCDDGSDEGPECQSITRTPDATLNKPPTDARVQLLNTNAQNLIGHNREDPLTAPQWPHLNQSPDQSSIQYSEDINKGIFNHNGGLHITDNIQLQPDLTRQSFGTNSKDAYRSWESVGDPNILQNWPQQIQQFPLKPLQFPQKQPIYYPSDAVQKNANGMSDQTILKIQPQFNWPIIGPNIHPNHNNEEILPEKNAIGVIKDVPVLDRKKDGKNVKVQSKSESKSTEDSDYNNEEEEETTTEPPKKKKKHRKVNKIGKQPSEKREPEKDTSAQQLKMMHAQLQTEFMDHDGEADRPGGAVVSLALGILITIGLVMVVSCRTTAARKRIRRGKGYAHDADFLVNGMYL